MARGEVKTEQRKERKKERGSAQVPEQCGDRREEGERPRRERKGGTHRETETRVIPLVTLSSAPKQGGGARTLEHKSF